MTLLNETITPTAAAPQKGSVEKPNSFFNRFRRLSIPTLSNQSCDDEENTQATHVSDDSISSDNCSLSPPSPGDPTPFYSNYDPSDPLTATYEHQPNNSIHKCLELLSSKDIDLNRRGLQKLNLLVHGRSALDDNFGSKEAVASVLVFGGPLGSMEELLRFFFATAICDDPQTYSDSIRTMIAKQQNFRTDSEEKLEDWLLYDYDASEQGFQNNENDDCEEDDDDNDGGSTYSFDWGDSEEPSHPQGKDGGVLHNHALRILADALGHVYIHNRQSLQNIPIQNNLWKAILASLVQNIEHSYSVTATVYSMKILRLLSYFKPNEIQPLLRYSLYPILVHLCDYGNAHNLPMLTTEATKLLECTREKPLKRQSTMEHSMMQTNHGVILDVTCV